jgi:hypothetical protein
MSAYLNFLQVFFSYQFTDFLDLEDIPNYRRICKKARDQIIELCLDPNRYTKFQLNKIFSDQYDDCIINDNTYI